MGLGWFSRKRKPPVEHEIVVDDNHSLTTTTDYKRPSMKSMWTHTVGPTVHCPGSGRRGIVTVKDDVQFVRCRRCRYAVQIGWGRKMQEHEREATGYRPPRKGW